jgi:ABC-type sulfate/molybdate transport systems ATPase subunit
MKEILRNHTIELRTMVNEFKLFGKEKDIEIKPELLPKGCNIILFGPTGSGKSSLIR